jgi:GMP synthase (glutamine-hydrolysing)
VSGQHILVVQHEDQCPPAWFGDWLTEAGHDLDVRRPYARERLPTDLSGHDALLVLGGTMNAYDDALHSWLTEVKGLARVAARDAVPALGICLGHQLFTVALGGTVVRNPRGQQLGLTPTGWHPEVDEDPLFGGVGRPPRAVQWNNDIVEELPAGAQPLASTPDGDVQVARFAPTVWGVQMHPEADENVVAPWAAHDRPLHPEGVVAAAVSAIGNVRDELAQAWRPLAQAFAELTVAGP